MDYFKDNTKAKDIIGASINGGKMCGKYFLGQNQFKAEINRG